MDPQAVNTLRRLAREMEPQGKLPSPCDLHRQLLETCSQCRREWDALGTLLQGVFHRALANFGPSESPRIVARADLSTTPGTMAALETVTSDLRRLARRSKKQLSELRLASPERRIEMVRRANARFRQRFLAHLLIDEARKVVRTDPDEALSWAALVALVLNWTRGPDQPQWATVLMARAEAHYANALRVRGDLPEAEAKFDELTRSPAFRGIEDAAALGEIASLEASLCIDQRRFEAAGELLGRAERAFTHLRDVESLARIRVQQANLAQTQGDPTAQLRYLSLAAESLPDSTDPIVRTALVAGRVNCLCDLDRAAEAQGLLATQLDLFEHDETPFSAGILRALQGRVALGLGEFGTAEDNLTTSVRIMTDLGRHYDASLAALYLAEALLAQSRLDRLYTLTHRLVQSFERRGVAGEAKEACEMLAAATLARSVSAALLRQVRQRLTATSPA